MQSSRPKGLIKRPGADLPLYLLIAVGTFNNNAGFPLFRRSDFVTATVSLPAIKKRLDHKDFPDDRKCKFRLIFRLRERERKRDPVSFSLYSYYN